MKPALLVFAALFALPALADAPKLSNPEGVIRMPGVRQEPPPKWPRAVLSLEPKFGAGLPFFGVPASPLAGLELAYAPPILSRQLLVGLEVSYARSSFPGAYGGDYSTDVDQLGALAHVAFHFLPDGFRISPYAGAGGGICAMRAVTSFEPQNATRSVRELRPAVVGFVGAQIFAGAGSVEIELRGQHSPSRTPLLRDSSVVPVSLLFGYRIKLL